MTQQAVRSQIVDAVSDGFAAPKVMTDALKAYGTESRDIYEVFTERHRAGSIIVTSNRGPDEWLGTFADPTRGQAAIDRFTSNAYDFVIEGDSYRHRQKPTLINQPAPQTRPRRRK